MSLTDPIADMLTRVRNGLRMRRETVNVRANKVCQGICVVLKEEGYIEDYRRIEDDKQGILRIFLRYESARGGSVFRDMERISKPGRRVYVGREAVPRVKGGYGTSILSTSQGLMTGVHARQKGIGGELVCQIW